MSCCLKLWHGFSANAPGLKAQVIRHFQHRISTHKREYHCRIESGPVQRAAPAFVQTSTHSARIPNSNVPDILLPCPAWSCLHSENGALRPRRVKPCGAGAATTPVRHAPVARALCAGGYRQSPGRAFDRLCHKQLDFIQVTHFPASKPKKNPGPWKHRECRNAG